MNPVPPTHERNTPVSTSPIDNLSIEEKAGLGSGGSFWRTRSAGTVTSLMLTDGPHGLRKQGGSADHLGLAESIPATCFPPAVAMAQSWNPNLVARVAQALGTECQAEQVGVLLGPGINIKRDPRGGRNFEYYSEDPHLSGALGTAWVAGIQSQGVGASVKHFAANNAETDRLRSSSDVDERTLREIYLRAFQRVVQHAQPWTVMSSYNKINGVYTSQDPWLLTDVLRTEWGFSGAVVSDWGGVEDRVAAVAAGLDLQMPGDGGREDAKVVQAVTRGDLDIAAVDRAAGNVAALAAKIDAARQPIDAFDVDAHHQLAREAAAQAIVLLKNEAATLPIAATDSIAIIGAFATTPRYQGGGSSRVNPTKVDVPLNEIRGHTDADVVFAHGFTVDGSGDEEALREEAVTAASNADVAILFLGLDDAQESEGFDREHIELPTDQLTLARAVAAAQPRTIAVLAHGGVVRLNELADIVPAILDGALLGQGLGAAIADVLFGVVNPSGKIAETVPVRLADVPAYLNFPGSNSHVLYGEGIFVGYRWYDARDLDVTFPFGHGLSYTRFSYSNLTVTAGDEGIEASVTVTNSGDRAGREIVQFYIGLAGSNTTRPARELKGFGSVTLEPGSSDTVSITISRDDLAYWETRTGAWAVEPGTYSVSAAASSRDIRLTETVEVVGDQIQLPVSGSSTIGELMSNPATADKIMPLLMGMVEASGANAVEENLGMDMMKMVGSIPLSRLMKMGESNGPDIPLDALFADNHQDETVAAD